MLMIVKYRIRYKIDMNNQTEHIKERCERLKEYLSVKPLGELYDSFLVDKNHKNGYEVHVITDNGYIIIFNKRTGKCVTVLHARPGQLKRYYNMLGENIPSAIENMCYLNYYLNSQLNLNNI